MADLAKDVIGLRSNNPEDTYTILRRPKTWPDNLHLVFHRYPFLLRSGVRRNGALSSGRYDTRKLDKLFGKSSSNDPGLLADLPFAQLQARQYAALQAATETQLSFEVKGVGRLLLGTGNPSINENGLTLHHVYGFPYLPASALKGLVRNYIVQSYFASEEEQAERDHLFCALFGCQAHPDDQEQRRGQVIFTDGYPVTMPRLEVDVLTPHFPKYYNSNGGEAPRDDDNPNPVTFLAVAAGTRFTVALGTDYLQGQTAATVWKLLSNSKICKPEKAKIETPLQLVRHYLVEALDLLGIGAKTAVGYGSLTINPKPKT